jgi:DeoR/GlpR family transcriptional regulator of sugar metabolism
MESANSDGITILTNSVPVAELVQSKEAKDVQVIVTGGVVSRSNSLVGPIADKVILTLRVNCAFLGTHSVSLSRGFLTPNPLEASTNSALMSIADRSIVLADHTKWDNTSLSVFASFSEVSKLITDSQLSTELQEHTREKIQGLIIAAPQKARMSGQMSGQK